MDTLLPANATPFEQALSLTIGPRLLSEPLGLRGFKLDPPDAVVPWLVWELGLSELLPYVPQPRRLLAEGVRFQRLRGTPEGYRMGLGWLGLDAAVVEESGAGPYFATFQLDPGRLLDGPEIERLMGLSRIARPLRSRLARIYHGLDWRPLVLDEGGELLDDWSGGDVITADGIVRVSFGVTLAGGPIGPEPHACHGASLVRAGGAARVPDGFRLDVALLDDDGEILVLPGYRAELRAVDARMPHDGAAGGWHLPRATLVADRDCLDGLVEGVLDPRGLVETGGGPGLDDDALDDTPWALAWAPVDVRDRVEGSGNLLQAPQRAAVTGGRGVHVRLLVVGVTAAAGGRTEIGGGAARYEGQSWPVTRWPDTAWNDLRIIGASTHGDLS